MVLLQAPLAAGTRTELVYDMITYVTSHPAGPLSYGPDPAAVQEIVLDVNVLCRGESYCDVASVKARGSGGVGSGQAPMGTSGAMCTRRYAWLPAYWRLPSVVRKPGNPTGPLSSLCSTLHCAEHLLPVQQ